MPNEPQDMSDIFAEEEAHPVPEAPGAEEVGAPALCEEFFKSWLKERENV